MKAAPAARIVQRLLNRLIVPALALLLGMSPLARAEFSVNPVRLELGAAARSGAIVVRNDGKVPLGFQMQAMEWTQDADGKDRYADSADLIFFPKIMTIAPGEEGVVRVGVRTPVVQNEKTYRLFIEQLPPPKDESAVQPLARPGASVTLLIRFGAPIFVAPVQPRDAAEVTAVALERGRLSMRVRNTGNRHQIIQGIDLRATDAQGAEIWTLTIADRYLLNGVAKPFSATIPAAQCARATALHIDVRTDKSGAKHKLDVQRAMCP